MFRKHKEELYADSIQPSCGNVHPGMKEQRDNFWDFGMARFTGFVIGRCFSITYHSGHEWNRRVTNEKNRAVGFVREVDGCTQVHFIHLAGMTNPLSLAGMFLACMVMLCISARAYYPEFIWASLVITAIFALSTAIQDSVTEQGQYGARMLMAFLQDPSDYASHVWK